MTRARTGSLLLAAATVLLITAPAAHAERDVHRDASGDVRRLEVETEEQSPAPQRTDPDIRRTVVVHGPVQVRIRLRVADLRPGRLHIVSGRIRTAAGETAFGWWKEPGGPVQGGVFPGAGDTCPAPRARFDTERDLVIAAVPRRCLDDPAWVRVGVGVGTLRMDEQTVAHVDDARTRRVENQAVLGPRIHVG